MYRQTIQTQQTLRSIGLHTGKTYQLTLTPAPSNTGIILNQIPLNQWEIQKSDWATRIKHNEQQISTIEHLLGYLFLANINDIDIQLIEVDHPQSTHLEVPILDGSALIYDQTIHPTIALPPTQLTYQTCHQEINLSYLQSSIQIRPYHCFELNYHFQFPKLKEKKLTLTFHQSPTEIPLHLQSSIKSARTFGFRSQEALLRNQGLILGISLDHCLIYNDQESELIPMNPLRFEDEPAFHKLLDILGDLMRINQRFLAQINIIRGSHQLHAQAVELLKSQWHDLH